MRLSSVLFFSVCALLDASVAHAVTINVVPSIHRVASDGVTAYSCPNRSTPGCVVEGTFQGVGSQDCNDDTSLSIPVTMTGIPDPSGTLQIWAGPTDCSQPGATNNTATATCWQVAPPPLPMGAMDIDVRVADIAAFIGAPSPPQTYQAAAAKQACANAAADVESTINVYLLWFPNGQTTPTVSSSAIPVKVKLRGPGPCTSVTATSASDTSLVVSWIPPAGDPTIAGFDLFAAPGNACGDASAIDSSHVNVTLWGAPATQGTISDLATQQSYEVAVAAVDEFGNMGDLSPSGDCATPGNNLLKGSCGCSTVGARSEGAGFFAIAAALIFGARRRRRRRS